MSYIYTNQNPTPPGENRGRGHQNYANSNTLNTIEQQYPPPQPNQVPIPYPYSNPIHMTNPSFPTTYPNIAHPVQPSQSYSSSQQPQNLFPYQPHHQITTQSPQNLPPLPHIQLSTQLDKLYNSTPENVVGANLTTTNQHVTSTSQPQPYYHQTVRSSSPSINNQHQQAIPFISNHPISMQTNPVNQSQNYQNQIYAPQLTQLPQGQPIIQTQPFHLMIRTQGQPMNQSQQRQPIPQSQQGQPMLHPQQGQPMLQSQQGQPMNQSQQQQPILQPQQAQPMLHSQQVQPMNQSRQQQPILQSQQVQPMLHPQQAQPMNQSQQQQPILQSQQVQPMLHPQQAQPTLQPQQAQSMDQSQQQQPIFQPQQGQHMNQPQSLNSPQIQPFQPNFQSYQVQSSQQEPISHPLHNKESSDGSSISLSRNRSYLDRFGNLEKDPSSSNSILHTSRNYSDPNLIPQIGIDLSNIQLKVSDQIQFSNGNSSIHSYSIHELRSFVEYTNCVLAGDLHLRDVLPISCDGDSFFQVITRGILLCKLTNHIKPDTIPSKNINYSPKSTYEMLENQTLAIKGAKDLGCNLVNIGPDDLITVKPHLMLGVVWQLIRADLLIKVSVTYHPEIVVLLEPNENVNQLLNVTPESIIFRWFNWHLKRASHPRKVANFSTDICDGENYLVILSQIVPDLVPKDAHLEPDPVIRAQMICDYAYQMNAIKLVNPGDILDGNEKLNLAFCAYLFNHFPSLGIASLEEQNHLNELEQILGNELEDEEMIRQQRWEQEDRAIQLYWKREDEKRLALNQIKEQEKMLYLEEKEKFMIDQMERERLLMVERIKKEREEWRAQITAEQQAMDFAKEQEWRNREMQFQEALMAEEEKRRQWQAEQQQTAMLQSEEWQRLKLKEDIAIREAEEKAATEREVVRQQAWAEYNAKQEALTKKQQGWTKDSKQQDYYTANSTHLGSSTNYAANIASSLQQTLSTSPQPSQTLHHSNSFSAGDTTPAHTWPIRKFSLRLIMATRLPKSSYMDLDTYAVITLNSQISRTKTIKNTQEPTWNFEVDLYSVNQNDQILIQIYDRKAVTKDSFLGEVKLTKDHFFQTGNRWYPLKSRSYKTTKVQGELLLTMTVQY